MQMSDVIEAVHQAKSHVKVLSGDDGLTLPLMSLGGHGVFSVISNLIPGPVKQMVEAGLKGDLHQARALHYQLLPFFKAVFLETNPIPIKVAMMLCGMPSGECRLPLCPLSTTNHLKIKQLINSLPPAWLGQHG